MSLSKKTNFLVEVRKNLFHLMNDNFVIIISWVFCSSEYIKENKKRKCKSHLLLHIKDAFLKVQKILTIIITVKAHDL